ncbi:hypothetical protein CCY99_04585 [Helicobacter sp. 16-1353]|uniref:DUF4153 domain-containing protein n=1 Tax=Helicobacter sp. 16-1353 TaxID=2004996 RepID=UPI000DCF5717|nr:DUF4153 domain-containing protein [Helicobacter sp. 16-1353]RAX54293.1 hypothetical protein CCY99_04585 [Helicobacter sp. 16-1353]
MFRLFFRIFLNANVYFKLAFKEHFFGSLICLIAGICGVIISLKLGTSKEVEKILFLSLMLIPISLSLESLKNLDSTKLPYLGRLFASLNAFFKKPNPAKIAIFFALIFISIPIYFYIVLPLMAKDIRAIYQFFALIFAFSSIFIALNLRDNYTSFLYIVFAWVLLGLFFLLFLILSGIMLLFIEMLFKLNLTFRLFDMRLAILNTIFGIFFIGFIANLHTFIHRTLINKKIAPNNALNVICKGVYALIHIFAYIYILLLLIYFIFVWLGFISGEISNIALCAWFCVFGLILVWLNKGLFGDSIKVEDSAKTIDSASADSTIFKDSTKSSNFIKDSIDSTFQDSASNLAKNPNKWGRNNNILLGFLLFFTLIIFYSIIVRVLEYGITPSRYMVFLGTFGVFIGIICTFIFKKPLKNLLFFFAFLSIISSFGAFSAINLSINSQLRELQSLELVESNAKRIASIYHFLREYGAESSLDSNIESWLKNRGFNTESNIDSALDSTDFTDSAQDSTKSNTNSTDSAQDSINATNKGSNAK